MAFRWTSGQPARHAGRMSMLLAILAGLTFGAPGWAATVQRVDVQEGRITIRFDEAVRGASSFILNAPQRIAIDIDGAAPGRASGGDGAVTAVRQGWRGADGARVVLDLAEPMIVSRGEFQDDGRTLELSLRQVDGRRFAAASAASPLSFLPFEWGKAKPRYKVSIPVPPARKSVLPRVRGDESRPLVVIDAGHGGNDPGAINPETGLREKDVTLKIARAIRDELLESGRVRVALTRDDDRYILHRERFGVARQLGADLFISIHCDSAGNVEASGATAYTLSDIASDKEAARLAARENKADIIAGVNLDESEDVSSILIDLTQRETMNASAGFARLLGREAKPLIPVKGNFHRMASLLVLKAPDMPSILFETGYISNAEDAAFLDSEEGRERIAQSVRRAVDIHFARRMAQTASR
ncbi:N-acetylmuramoyl-L-alanine amidase [Sphingomonas sp. OV641]|uniref:N-acetylmuramoyl-L-alanine amidase n=1 Tax=unclassified Sphingomonas TaxID=196159 RepID=UPI0008364839|nr:MULTISPECIES: N-acetylmuramoyl-L-alanine amidase [unclassified Sphingomonas]SEJ41955.1 N-acetylmuramoyl-L-alanine amidase [Sphingomonas sp. OV641]